MKNIVLSYSITPVWQVVRNIEEKIREIFVTKNDELFNATIMVVSELVENAVKYGMDIPTVKSINFNFSVSKDVIVISVANPVDQVGHIDELKDHIHDIQNCDDPQSLYIRRLEELLENTNAKRTQLGLYRIAYEGKYDLSYEYDGKIITVNAIRTLT